MVGRARILLDSLGGYCWVGMVAALRHRDKIVLVGTLPHVGLTSSLGMVEGAECMGGHVGVCVHACLCGGYRGVG